MIAPGSFGILDLGQPYRNSPKKKGTKNEFAYSHHVICLSSDLGGVAYFVPLTTIKENGPEYKHSLYIDESVTGRECWILCAQLKALDYKMRKYIFKGVVPDYILSQITNKVGDLLFQSPTPPAATKPYRSAS